MPTRIAQGLRSRASIGHDSGGGAAEGGLHESVSRSRERYGDPMGRVLGECVATEDNARLVGVTHAGVCVCVCLHVCVCVCFLCVCVCVCARARQQCDAMTAYPHDNAWRQGCMSAALMTPCLSKYTIRGCWSMFLLGNLDVMPTAAFIGSSQGFA